MLNGTFELCAEGAFSRHDVAQMLGESFGAKIEVGLIRPNAAEMSATCPDGSTAARLKMFSWYDDHGLIGNGFALRAILGREPRTLQAFLNELNLNAYNA